MAEKVCPLCASRKIRSTLKLYHINEDEAIYMCSSSECPYPVGVSDPEAVVENRPVPELKISTARKLFDFAFFPNYCLPVALLLLVVECGLVPFIITRVPYTEIDWLAYMQEVEGFLNGSLDYSQLKGDTGPLVYPAGFVYIFSCLYWITDRGTNIHIAQCLFGVLYMINIAIVMKLYVRISKNVSFPPVLLIFITVTAYRVHSIFVLRLFNDAVAMTILYTAVLVMVDNHWTLGCILYSVAVSVKMNVILFAPGLLVLLLHAHGIKGTLIKISLCGLVQLLLGLPFLVSHPISYITGAFDLSRVFLFKWTVNWRFLPEAIFVSRWFHFLLLVGHISMLLVFAYKHLISNQGDMKYILQWEHMRRIKAKDVVTVLFISNAVGVCFSRSLHYQFYVWYYHTLPLLFHLTPVSTPLVAGLLLLVEYCWNVYPSTVLSSILLLSAHIVLLTGLLFKKKC